MRFNGGQMMIEYLVIFIAVAVLTLFAGAFFSEVRTVTLEDHFQSAAGAITTLR